jgi:hypothetical protein
MIGLISIKEHQKQLNKIKKLLEREKLRSLYWNLKCINPNDNPIVFGNKETIEYITKNNVIKKINY